MTLKEAGSWSLYCGSFESDFFNPSKAGPLETTTAALAPLPAPMNCPRM
jgi:hypothetical protein